MELRIGRRMKVLSQQQVEFYKREGYLHAPDVLSQEALDLAERILRDWSERQIAQWVEDGLINDARSDLDFTHRMAQLWKEAGHPSYMRSPRRDLVGPEMYRLLLEPSLLDMAEDLLGTDELSVHGIFNARPKLPDQRWTDTPWHQDAQYYRDAEAVHVVSIWFPLQAVREKNSCLQVASQGHRDQLFDDYHDEETGFKGIDRAEWDTLQGISVEMERGDALCFTQLTPHRALSNRGDAVRWSMDLRYEATATATTSGKTFGFVARSGKEPETVMGQAEWLAKWDGIAEQTY